MQTQSTVFQRSTLAIGALLASAGLLTACATTQDTAPAPAVAGIAQSDTDSDFWTTVNLSPTATTCRSERITVSHKKTIICKSESERERERQAGADYIRSGGRIGQATTVYYTDHIGN